MKLEITPEPSAEERAAIEAALAPDARGAGPSAWADLLLPERGEEAEPYPSP
jgi:hypothetical protein